MAEIFKERITSTVDESKVNLLHQWEECKLGTTTGNLLI